MGSCEDFEELLSNRNRLAFVTNLSTVLVQSVITAYGTPSCNVPAAQSGRLEGAGTSFSPRICQVSIGAVQ